MARAMLLAVRGSSRTRTPSALCSALAIAATVGPMVHSPAPKDGFWFLIKCTSTGILQVFQPEGDGISASKLIHERFDGKHVAEGAERAQRRAVHRRLAHVVERHLEIRKVVAGNRIALRAACGKRRIDRRPALEGLR